MKTKIKYLISFLFFLFTIEYSFAQTGWGFRNPLPQNTIYKLDFININTGYGVCGAGLVISTTNGGNTWDMHRSLTGRNLYALYFFNVSSGYAVGDSGTIIYTSNSGVNWVTRNPGSAGSLNAITFTDLNTGFIAGANGNVLKTTNGGLNWILQTISSNTLNDIQFINLNTGFISGSGGLFAKTTNAGLNWFSTIIDTSTFRSVWFTSIDTGYAAGSNGLYKTVNGGLNWVSLNVINSYYNDMYFIRFINRDTGYCSGKNNPIMRTYNSGANWAMDITGIFGYYTYYDLCFTDSVRYISGTEGYVLKSSTSSEWQTVGGTKHNINSIAIAGVNNISACADNQTLFSPNGGINWKIDTYGQNNFFEPIYNHFKMTLFSNFNNGYRITRYGGGGTGVYWETVSRSTNGGVSWDAPGGWIGSWFTDIYGLDAVDNVALIAGRNAYQGGFIMKSVSAGNWETVYTNLYDSYYQVSMADANTGIVYGYAGSSYSILRTENSGLNWSTYNLPDGYHGNIQLLSSSIGLMISGDGIIYRSSNGGVTWSIQDTGLGNISSFKFVNVDKGWAVGNNGLILYSSDGGYNWQQQISHTNQNLRNVSFMDELNGVVGGDSGIVLKTTNGGITYIAIGDPIIPHNFMLGQNYPNPFNPKSKIKFHIAKLGEVKLVIFDVLGRKITTLLNERLSPGIYETAWDGSNFASGIYFYRLTANGFSETKKMVLTK